MDILTKISNVPMDALIIREPLIFNKDNVNDICENGFTCNKIAIYNNIFNLYEDEFHLDCNGTIFFGVLQFDGLTSVTFILSNNIDVFEIDGYLDGFIWKMTQYPIPLKYNNDNINIKIKFICTKCIKSIYGIYGYISENDKNIIMYIPYFKFNEYIELVCGMWLIS